MRHDAARLLTERERTGGRGGNLKTGLRLDPNKDWEEEDYGPRSVSCSARRQHGYESKSVNDFLSPLRQFLKKSVGRPWNDVYSEICAVADGRSMDGNHLRDHARQYVIRRHNRSWYGWGFYIDDDGILSYWQQKRPEKKPKPFNLIKLTDLIEYNFEKGFWYRTNYKFADPNEMKYFYEGYVSGFRKACESPGWNPYKREIVSVRQASKKEMRNVYKAKKLNSLTS